MKNTGTIDLELSSLRPRGGRSLVKIAVDAVANARIGTARKRAEPGRSTASRTERKPAPSETTACSSSRLGRRLQEHLATDRQAQARRSGSRRPRAGLAGRRPRPPRRACPPSRTRSGRPRSRPRRAGRRAGRRSRAGRAAWRASASPLRPGTTTMVAPFCVGTYQPSSRRPSLVVKETFSCGTPRSAAGT